MIALHHSALANAAMIASIVIAATVGDVLIASAMRQIGDLDEIKAESGLMGAIKAVVTNTRFFMWCGGDGGELLFPALCFEPRRS